MNAHPAPNPIRLLVRAANLIVAGLCGWAIWGLALMALDAGRGSWLAALGCLLPVLPLGLAGWYLLGGIRTLTRGHVALLSLAITLALWAALMVAATATMQHLFRPELADIFEIMAGFACLQLAVSLGLWIDWQLAGGLRMEPDRGPWWNQNNLQRYFNFFGFILYFTLCPLAMLLQSEDGPLRPEVRRWAEPLLFAGLILACVLFAQLTPRLLLALTGIPWQRPDKPARRRGFRLV